MRFPTAFLLLGILLLGTFPVRAEDTSEPTVPAPPRLGAGAAPGNARGPGGFVPRGTLRNFYAAAGGRLWYYMNNYYWVPESLDLEDLWLKTEVVEEFQDLRRWPHGTAVARPRKKRTVEYWQVGPTRRTVRVDNHKDYCLLSDQYTAGAIVVEVKLTLGHLEVRNKKDEWAQPKETYVLQWRNYSGNGGIGAENTRFAPLPRQAVTTWGYRVPWDTHPQKLTRSNWKRLELPKWRLLDPGR